MKKVILKRLIVSNWRSITFDVTLNDDVTTISGRNGIGKSTLFHAWSWLLTSYTDVENPKNTNLFDSTKELSEHTPEASVTAYITINGYSFVLKKTAKPCFVRDRESGEYVKSNTDTYKMFIDSVNVTATEFNAWLNANLCDTSMLMYCVDGSFFADLSINDRQKARKLLTDMVGELLDSDFHNDYKFLKDVAGNRSIEDFKKLRKTHIKNLEKEKQNLSVLIETYEKDLVDNKTAIEEKKKEIAKLELECLNLAKETTTSFEVCPTCGQAIKNSVNVEENVNKQLEISGKIKLKYKELGSLEKITAEEIDSMRAKQRAMSNEISSCYRDVFMCDSYLNESADIITAKINSKLNGYSIDMWSKQKNGERVADCVIVNGRGVPYSTLNGSDRIKACIAIQQMFCSHCGVVMPTFVDEASVFDSKNKPVLDSQTFFLMASDSNYLTID